MKTLLNLGLRILVILALLAGLVGLRWWAEIGSELRAPGRSSESNAAAPADAGTVPAVSSTRPETAAPKRSGNDTVASINGASPSATPDDADDLPESALARWQFGRAWGETNPTLRAFSQWTERYVAATNPAMRAELIVEGTALALQRRHVLEDLIKTDPAGALAVTVPTRWRQHLPVAVATNLEERISGRGDLAVLGATPGPESGFDLQAIQRIATLGDRRFSAHVFGRRQNLQTRSGLSLHGIALDGEMAVSDSPLRLLEAGETPDPAKPAEDTRCPISRQSAANSAIVVETGTRTYWLCQGGHIEHLEEKLVAADGELAVAQTYQNLGAKRLLVMLVDFSDLPGGPTTPENARVKMNQVNDFFRANSFGQMGFSEVRATPILRMPQVRSFYTSSARDGAFALLQDARAAALSAGLYPAAFEFDLVAFAGIGFNWGGLGYVGRKGAWVQGDLNPGIAAHELGHNVGLWHAGFWTAADGIGAAGTRDEYGNPYDVMGNSQSFPNGHFSANFKQLLGWLPASAVATASTPGTFRVYAMDAGGTLEPGRQYALEIPARIPVLGSDVDYWVDYRGAMGLLNGNPGATVQWGNRLGAANASLLIDTTPGSPGGKRDATIAPGETFSDSGRAVTVTIVGQGGSGPDAYLDIVVGPAPPPISLAEALDFSQSPLNTGGAAGWEARRGLGHDGVDGARSSLIGDGQSSWLETRITGPGHLSFWWKVSSEGRFDQLRLLVDGVVVEAISGEADWRQVAHSLSGGTHVIRWEYTKDRSGSLGADRGWLDRLNFNVDAASATRYVDGRPNPPGAPTPDGSLLRPYRQLSTGIDRVPTCGTLRLHTGIYRGPLTLTKCMRLESYGGTVVLGASMAGEPVPLAATGLTSPQRQSDGSVRIGFSGEVGRDYEVWRSDDLIHWEPWKEFVADESTFDLIDHGAANTPRRFFKLTQRWNP